MTYEQLKREIEAPEPRSTPEALTRNRALQQSLANIAVEAALELTPDVQHSLFSEDPDVMAYVSGLVQEAAEHKHPGFHELASQLVERERELLYHSEPTC